MIVKPFSPAEAASAKKGAVPQELIQAINQLLAERIKSNGRSITIKAHEIVSLAESLMSNDGDYTSRTIPKISWYDKGFMDFEPIYEAEGWKISYTRPDYTESFDSYYEFTPKKG